jgi:hypothetical protein
MRDLLEQILAVHARIPEAVAVKKPMRVEAAPADLHDRAGPALRTERVSADLPGHRRRVVKGVVEAGRHDFEAGVGCAWIGGAEGVELLDAAVGVDHEQRARQQTEPLHLARTAEYERDELAEKTDSRLLPRGRVPAFEDADQPVGVPSAGRG